jgi:hypothetical protein
MGRAQVYFDTTDPNTVPLEFVLKSKQKGGCPIVSTSQRLLELIVGVTTGSARPKISEYAGSIISYKEVEFLFIDPLKNLVSTPTGKFILQRFLNKFLNPQDWVIEPPFKWELFTPSRLEFLCSYFDSCSLIGIDLETRIGDPLKTITCVGFCGLQISQETGKLSLVTVVVPMNEEYNILFVRYICSTAAPKVLQNGKYDIAYLFRYGIPITNYSFDTINLFHSWLSELPKDLGFISAFMVRNYTFHKNDGKTGDLLDYYQYNAKDCYTTVLSCLALILEVPEYAIGNFLQEFPVVFPCILSEHTGLKYDPERATIAKGNVEKDMESRLLSLRKMVGNQNYNPNSPQQTVRLFHILGSKDITSSADAEKDKVANRHPLNKRIIDTITSYREDSKLRGSYYKEGISWLGRTFYALNPHGTDTGRLAARESQFWCGLQIHNIPRNEDGEDDDSVKECFVADDGFYIGEADYAQNESRGTGYITGDTALIKAVDDPSKDFHGTNASSFFGLPYEEIVNSYWDAEEEEWVHEALNKPIRQLSKNTNHGASYNMREQVMLDTMKIAKVLQAKKLLKLPVHWTLLQVTGHLLKQFANTYSVVRYDYQKWIKQQVKSSGLLVGPTGWTRRCFGDPTTNKHFLNAYIAHCPQSLAAMLLNKAYLRVFTNIYLPNPKDFKLHTQIHDSILFSYRKGREDLAFRVAEEMRIPTPVKDIFGVTRTLIVPVDLKGEGTRWSDVKKLKKSKGLKIQKVA